MSDLLFHIARPSPQKSRSPSRKSHPSPPPSRPPSQKVKLTSSAYYHPYLLTSYGRLKREVKREQKDALADQTARAHAVYTALNSDEEDG